MNKTNKNPCQKNISPTPLCSLWLIIFLYISTFTFHHSLFSIDDPAWWNDETDTDIIDNNASKNDFGPANLGQLKNVAKNAQLHMDNSLTSIGGAGTEITTMVGNFIEVSAANSNAINLGQLKNIATPYYDRLVSIGYDTRANLIARGFPEEDLPSFYPWDPATPTDINYNLATIGHLKMVFSFDLSVDSDGDSLLDWWEYYYFNSLVFNKLDDTDNDGITNENEFNNATNPTSSSYVGIPDGMLFWMKADEGIITDSTTSLITTWNDQSGNNNQFGQGNDLHRPTYVTDDNFGHPVIRFKDGNEFLQSDSVSGQIDNFSVVFVFKPTINSNVSWNQSIGDHWGSFLFHSDINDSVIVGIGFQNNKGRIVPGTNAGDSPTGIFEESIWNMWSYTHKNGTGRLYKNGNLIAEKHNLGNPDSWLNFHIGQFNNSFDGDLLEVLFYDRALDAQQIANIAQTYDDKYGVITKDRDGDGLDDTWELAKFNGDLSKSKTDAPISTYTISITTPQEGQNY